MMPNPTPYQHFVRLVAALMGGALALVAVIAIAIDATGIWDTPTLRGFNANKSQQHLYERMAKAHAVMRLKPTSIILGSSRARLALDPRAFERLTGRPIYNLGLGSPHITELEAYFRHALFNQPDLKDVVLVVELQEFGTLSPATLAAQDFLADRLETHCLPIQDYVAHTLTFTALADSLMTWQANQSQPDVRPYGPQGQDLALPWREPMQNVGPVVTFEQYLHLAERHLTEPYPYDPSAMQSLARVVAVCHAHGIHLTVMTSPVHAVEWESLWQQNQGADLLRWERDLARTTEFWDFGGFNATTTVAIAKTMPYLDPAHYLPAVGESMLARVYGKGSPDFGEHVDATSIEDHLERLQALRAKWLADHPPLARRLAGPPPHRP